MSEIEILSDILEELEVDNKMQGNFTKEVRRKQQLLKVSSRQNYYFDYAQEADKITIYRQT